MEIVFSLLVLIGLASTGAQPATSRVEALHSALDDAVMLHRSSSRHRVSAFERPVPAIDHDQEVELDLIYMELDGSYLARACVCDPRRVFELRLMIAYAAALRVVGHSDREVVERLASSAGEHEPEVRQLLNFAGVDGIGHFICVDYLHKALQTGISEPELRRYIDRVGASPPAQIETPRKEPIQLASGQ